MRFARLQDEYVKTEALLEASNRHRQLLSEQERVEQKEAARKQSEKKQAKQIAAKEVLEKEKLELEN
ncbi:hypothetical protein CR513_05726, partial [Mucuna pruriens]